MFYLPSEALIDVCSCLSACVRTDLSQVQCIKSYQAQEHDELTLEKADILQAITITSDGKKIISLLLDTLSSFLSSRFLEDITAVMFFNSQGGWMGSGCRMERGAGSPKHTWRRSQAPAPVCETSARTFALSVSHKNLRERLFNIFKYGTKLTATRMN